MRLDMVHDIQNAYRKVLDSMSRPGIINNIYEQAQMIDIDVKCSKVAIILALMLLDTEVTFKVAGIYEKEIERLINQLTYAEIVNAGDAGFIFILNDATQSAADEAIESAHPGDLMNPHNSATIIMEARAFSGGSSVSLTGPGIDGSISVEMDYSHQWIDIREQKNLEYPIGVDMIFFDDSGKLMCIPRTTIIRL